MELEWGFGMRVICGTDHAQPASVEDALASIDNQGTTGDAGASGCCEILDHSIDPAAPHGVRSISNALLFTIGK